LQTTPAIATKTIGLEGRRCPDAWRSPRREKPTAIAAMRGPPTRSPSHGPASSATNNGDRNEIVEVFRELQLGQREEIEVGRAKQQRRTDEL